MGFVLLRGDSIPKSILGRLRNSGTSFLFYNLIFGFSIKGIDMAAHLGGLAAGFACGLILSQPLDQVSSSDAHLAQWGDAGAGRGRPADRLASRAAAPVDLHGRLTQFSSGRRKGVGHLQRRGPKVPE